MIQHDDHIEIQLTEPQLKFHVAEQAYVAMVAGFGAGKTQTGVINLLENAYSYPTMNWGWIEPSYPLVRDIFYPKIEEMLTAQNMPYRINKQEHRVYIEGHGHVVCKTMVDPEKIVGFECGDFYLDEFDTAKTEVAMKVWQKCLGRIRQKFPIEKDENGIPFQRKNRIRVMTTPEGFKATYQIFVKQVAKMRIEAIELQQEGKFAEAEEILQDAAQYCVIHASTYSNQHNLPDGYIRGMRAAYPEELIDAYLMGLFVNLTAGRVYPAYNREENNCDTVATDREMLHIGLDFNVGKMAAVVHVIRDGKPHAVGELFKLQDTPAMIQAINNKYPSNAISVYPDSSSNARKTQNASETDLKLLKDAKFIVHRDSKNPFIKDRLNSMNAAFRNADAEVTYRVNSTLCPNYVDCLEQQAYDTNGLPDKTNDLDHLPDAGGYFINKKFGITKERIIKKIMRGM